MMFTPFDNLFQNRLVHLFKVSELKELQGGAYDSRSYIRDRDSFGNFANILKHVLDKDRAFGYFLNCLFKAARISEITS